MLKHDSHELRAPVNENGPNESMSQSADAASRPVVLYPVYPKTERNPSIIKGCFIATAAMGSALHPHVQLLRDFRDDILLQSRYKETFEHLLNKYYKISPPIAAKMNENRFVKLMLRYALVYPIVFGIKGILPIVNLILGIERDARRKQRHLMPQ